jgi:hypothetical protein
VATGLLSGDEISGPLRSIFSHQKNVDVLLDEVTGINSNQHIVHLTRGDLGTTSLSSRLASSTTILDTTNGDSSPQASNRSMMQMSSAAKYCVRSSEPKKWPRSNKPGPRKFAAS